jgi:hypothetical protein
MLITYFIFNYLLGYCAVVPFVVNTCYASGGCFFGVLVSFLCAVCSCSDQLHTTEVTTAC